MNFIRLLHIFILVFFIILIILPFIANIIGANIIEGLDPNDPLYISKTTAADIQTLKREIEELEKVYPEISRIEKENIKSQDDIKKVKQKKDDMTAKANKGFDEEMKKNEETNQNEPPKKNKGKK
jgi:preprotein translocase subunit SecF